MSARPRWLAGLWLGVLMLAPAAAAPPALLWFQGGQPTAQAEALLAQLAAAGDRGLDSGDYGGAAIEAMLARLQRNPAAPAESFAAADRALSRAALDFAHDVHVGRIDARAAGFSIGPPRPALERDAILARLATSRDLAAEFAALEPPFLHYRLLEAALRRYRALAAQPALTQLPPLPQRTLRLQDQYEGAPALRRLLVAVGDLAAADAIVTDGERARLDARLVQALMRFQGRHGLAADGLLSRRTYAALTVPMSARARQIELTLERWRWLPPFTAPPIIVNIPQFQLFAFRSTDDRAADIAQMPVIVGQSFRDKRTPVFVSEIRSVVFRPYWDVPSSIVRNEMLAPMRKDVGFLERNHYEIVRGGGDDARPVAADASAIEALAAGQLRLRQRPGPDNALGLIKFVLPNDYGVYLHSTPARALFGKARRDFSHGCIRVSDPVALAVHVLRGNRDNWSADAVNAAMQGADARRIALATPVPVMILYATVLATEAGPVLFFDDIYGHDRRLAQMLRVRSLRNRAH
ncbi:MAG: L,D-transpeptidase family protein [Proteobacteria bacterium]|nr:L,D-transpeptidase family protein [Pseudomonadota bacterium]